MCLRAGGGGDTRVCSNVVTPVQVRDMLTTLGVSAATIKTIERRNVVDRAIVFGGMGVTTFCLYLLWRWVR